MFNIEKYLQKFSKDIQSTESNKEQIVEIINKYTDINIPTEDIEIKNYTVLVKSSPSIKNKLFIYKDKILKDIILSVSIKIVDIR
jgi:hypothetical protein